MFGRKEPEKRSLEEMFTPRDEATECGDEDPVCADFEENKEECEDVIDEKNYSASIKPLDCFGMEQEKTEKWLAKCAKFWFCFMSFLWFLFGALTFAPVIFISNKVNVIFKDKKKSLLCAILVHAMSVLLVLLFFSFR